MRVKETRLMLLLLLFFLSSYKGAFFANRQTSPVLPEIYGLTAKCNEVKKEIPILCYHNVVITGNTGITVSKKRFEEQMQLLYDSGYNTILPDDLYKYLADNKRLPEKSFLVSFDDARLGQYTIAEPVLNKFGFKAVFFIMTICVGKPGYLSTTQIKELADKGHVIAAHTYDHSLSSNQTREEWEKQLEKPKRLLEEIIKRPVEYFAYPNGVWTERAIAELKHYGYKGAFQLTGKLNIKDPLFSLRRLMVEENCTAVALYQKMKYYFH